STGKLEYDLISRPGSDIGAVQLEFEGVTSMQVDQSGNLHLQTAGGELIQEAPQLYQADGDTRTPVSGSFVLDGDNRVSFAVTGSYDISKPLVIDPSLDFSTYLGGSGDESGLALAVDGTGNTYITGSTTSTNFPTLNPFQSTLQGTSDAFVTKFNA